MSATQTPPVQRGSGETQVATAPRATVGLWLLHDAPYIAMLVLAMAAVTLQPSVGYWVLITVIFAVICIVAGWRGSQHRQALTQFWVTQVLSWLAVILAFYISHTDGVQGVMNVPGTSLAKLTQLALGTFIAGLQARVWRICAVGVVLFIAVPALGWVKQSALLLFALTIGVIALGGVTWWIDHRVRQRRMAG